MKRNKWILPSFLILAGCLMIVAGVIRGEHQAVMEKAIRICLECIGIG